MPCDATHWPSRAAYYFWGMFLLPSAQEILSHPKEWQRISREEALRYCAFRTVVVVYSQHGPLTTARFNRGSPLFHKPGGPDSRYFLLIQEAPAKARGAGAAPSSAGPAGSGGGSGSSPGSGGSSPFDESAPPVEAVAEGTKQPPAISITKLDCECFAPLEESVLIHYEITGDLELVQSVRLRVAAQKEPAKFLLEKSLSGKPQAKGMYMWDGAVTDAGFAGCINLLSSPYLLQLGLTPKGGTLAYTNKATVKVELMQTELAIGDESGLGENEDNFGVLEPLKEDLRKFGGKGKIRLNSSLFKEDGAEMKNDKSFRVYHGALHKGAPIPLFLRLWLKGKGGNRVRSSKAVAKTPILWDALPEQESDLEANLSERGVHDTAKRFIKKAAAHKHGESEPAGITCHKDLGGMRVKQSDRGFSEKHWKTLWESWGAEDPKQRGWAALSQCGPSDEVRADCGIVFYNGRMAGDRHRIAAYVDLESKLDVKDRKAGDGVEDACKSPPLAFLNWREVKVTRQYKVGTGTVPLEFGESNREFNQAALSIIPKAGLFPEEIAERWKAAYQDIVKLYSFDSIIQNGAEPDPDGYPVRYRSYNDYWERIHPEKGFFGKLWHRIVGFFGTDEEKGYREKCDKKAYMIYSAVAARFPLGENGLTCFKFGKRGEHNMWEGAYTAGIAPWIAGYSNRYQSVLFVFDPGQAAHSVTHEIGHSLFLAHGPGHWVKGKNPGGYQDDAHDKDEFCLMSYHPDGAHFCGLCILKLSGWDYKKIHKDGKVDAIA